MITATNQGSPPQVRGKLSLRSLFRQCAGITPAGAGKTCFAECSRRQYWDHPRRCGENIRLVLSARIQKGSPPQVRGKHPEVATLVDNIRITPAGAGKT